MKVGMALNKNVIMDLFSNLECIYEFCKTFLDRLDYPSSYPNCALTSRFIDYSLQNLIVWVIYSTGLSSTTIIIVFPSLYNLKPKRKLHKHLLSAKLDLSV